ncbi:MAG: putative competence protein ComEC [Actinomycetota bacterium]
MRSAYGHAATRPWHHVSDLEVVAVACVVVAAAWRGFVVALLLAASIAVLRWRFGFAALAVGLAVVGSGAAWWAGAHSAPRHLGPYTGWVQMVGDPVASGRGVRATVEVQGERFDVWGYGPDSARLRRPQAGEWVWMAGERSGLRPGDGRAAVRHVVGRFEAHLITDVRPGSGVHRAANRVRGALRRAADSSMTPDHAALFTGLVIGDDARQPRWMLDEFRSSGLSHLTAVSGQNLHYVLAAAAPLLRRLRPWWRWAASVGLISWFALATRFEPSVLRAGAMAALGVTAFTLGRAASAVRLLAWAVVALLLVDPVLVRSVGFWLSVGATLGVSAVGPWLLPRLPGPAWVRRPLAVTLGAQVGVALPSLWVFGRLPVVSVAANLLAVPVAGLVMLAGLPVGAVASMLPDVVAKMVMLPLDAGTRWVATVAHVAAAAEPPGRWPIVAWAALLALMAGVALWRNHGSASSDR